MASVVGGQSQGSKSARSPSAAAVPEEGGTKQKRNAFSVAQKQWLIKHSKTDEQW